MRARLRAGQAQLKELWEAHVTEAQRVGRNRIKNESWKWSRGQCTMSGSYSKDFEFISY